ncbi:MAG: methionyl-tRNA formyltransferase, partial [Opitutales bacterium]
VKVWAREHGVEVRQPDRPGDEETRWLKALGCDLLLVMAYGHMLRDSLLDAPRLPPINFHASLLPELRGASPIETAIATGRGTTGVTLMRIVKKMDAGARYDVEEVPIGPADTRSSLADKLALACVPLLARALPRLAAGDLLFEPQDESRASYCRILDKDDSNLDFNAPARELHDRCRAFHLWPGTCFELQGQRIRLGSSAIPEDAPTNGAAPGTVLESGAGQGLLVATGSGALSMLTLQRPGGKMLPAAEFLRGMPIPSGTVLESRPMKPLER